MLPVKPSVDSGSKKKDGLPGSDAIKSVAPTTVMPSIALYAIVLSFFFLAPFIPSIVFLSLPAVLVLPTIFCINPPGTPNCVISATRSPLHVSGCVGSLSFIKLLNSLKKSVLRARSVPPNNIVPTPKARS